MTAPIPGLILLSGGVESTTMLYEYHQRIPMQALFVDYGQRAARLERGAARYHAEILQVPLALLNAAALGRQMNRARGLDFHVPFPQRNLWLMGVAINWAVSTGHPHLYVGWNAQDRDSDPSATQAHLPLWQQLSLGAVAVQAPFLSLAKADIIRRGNALGVDYARTYSCLRGRKVPCGRCAQCYARAQAHAAARATHPEHA